MAVCKNAHKLFVDSVLRLGQDARSAVVGLDLLGLLDQLVHHDLLLNELRKGIVTRIIGT